MAVSSSPVVVITGASAGVGRATAVAFAQRGYNVGLIARGATVWKVRGGTWKPLAAGRSCCRSM